ncbi:MAG: hypothetical protein ACJ79D_02035, partial [Myxococcales bacterium]
MRRIAHRCIERAAGPGGSSTRIGRGWDSGVTTLAKFLPPQLSTKRKEYVVTSDQSSSLREDHLTTDPCVLLVRQ